LPACILRWLWASGVQKGVRVSLLCIIISIGFAACHHSSAQSQKDTVPRPSHPFHKSNPLSPNSFSVQVHNFSANFAFLVNLLTFLNFPNGTKCSPASQMSLYHTPHNKCWCMPFPNRNILYQGIVDKSVKLLFFSDEFLCC
jgi:hypothetical protein